MSKSLINGSIYLWTNLINGKHYVGQVCTSVRVRYNAHINDSQKAKPKSGIGSGIKKYGLENFDFRVLCTGITDWEILNKLERYFIAEFDSLRNGYNQNEGGQAEFSRCDAWNDVDEIKRLYLEERMTTYQIADQYECSRPTIIKILNSIGVEMRVSSEKAHAWKDTEEIARLYTQEHMTTHQLAKVYECSITVICRILNSIGVEMRDPSEKTYAWEDKDEIARLYTEDFISTYQIAERYACSSTTIVKILKSIGVEMHPNGWSGKGKPSPKRHEAWDKADEIAHLYTEDLMSLYQLAEQYECSVPVISRILKDMGIDARDGKNPVWQHKEEVVRLYSEELLSINEIAEIYECSTCPIQDILESTGTPRRTGRRSQLLRLERERNKWQLTMDFQHKKTNSD